MGGPSCPVLVGREREIESLVGLLELVSRGGGTTAAISGVAGIGKTRLLAESLRLAEERGLAVMVGSCAEEDRGFPYFSISEALRSRLRSLSEDDLRAEAAGVDAGLAVLLPELGSRIAAGDARPRTIPEQNRVAISEAAFRYLARVAGGSGLLVAIEDVHWADRASLSLLRYVAQRLPGLPLLLLLTYRSDEVGPAHPVSGLVGALNARRLLGEAISLPPLTWPETRTMVRAVLRLDGQPRTAFVDELYSRAEGNPFFTEEILRFVLAAGLDSAPVDRQPRLRLPDALPPTVSDILERRIRRLSARTRRVLTCGAVIGRRFDAALLSAVTAAAPDAVSQALHEALDAHLIIDSGDGSGFEFRHALVQEAAAGMLLSSERKAFHRRIAETIEKAQPRGRSDVAVLAHHYARAGVAERSRVLAEQAGDAAWASGAPREAGRWYQQALSAAEVLGEPDPVPLLQKAAEAWREAGRYKEATELVAQVAAHHRHRADRLAEGDALCLQARLVWHAGETDTAAALYQAALSTVEPLGETIVAARVYAGLANLYLTAFRGTEAYNLARQARDAARRLGVAEVEACACRIMGTVLAAGPDPERGQALLRRAAEQAAAAGDPFEASVGYGNLVNACIKDADWPAGEEAAETGLAFCRERGMRSREGWIATRLAEIYRLTGRWREAEKLAEEAERLLDEESGQDWIIADTVRCSLLVDQGRWDRARDALEAMLPMAERSGEFQNLGVTLFLLARVAQAHGDLAQAIDHTERILALWRSTEDTSHGLPLLLFACHLFCDVGRRDDAHACVDDLRRVRERAATATVAACVAEAEALVAAAEESWEEAVEAWRRSAALWSQTGRPYDQARTTAGLGRALLQRRGAGDRDDARKLLLAARESFAGLGAAEVAAVDGLLRRSRLVAPPSRRAGEALSEREREIAVQVSRGLTNRQIAATLFVSEKTVENHVSRILAKLLLNSRAQLAAYAVETGLAADGRQS